MEDHGWSPIVTSVDLAKFLRRPETGYDDLKVFGMAANLSPLIKEQVEIATKYSGHITRQQEMIERMERWENTLIPDDIDYDAISSLKNEIRHRLKQVRPRSLAQAGRIIGVTPAAVNILMVYVRSRQMNR